MKIKNEESDFDEVLKYISINKEKYCERFSFLKTGKRKFNFCSAILGGCWLAFQFMFLEWCILIIMQFILEVGLNLLRAWTYDKQSMWLLLDIVNVFLNIAIFLFLGFFGDSLLIANIRRKIAFQKKRNGQMDWIKRTYKYEKVMVLRVLAVVISLGLFLIILGQLAPQVYSKLIY